MNKSECEWCGTPVRIVGDTTKHYESDYYKLLKANEIMREALLEIERQGKSLIPRGRLDHILWITSVALQKVDEIMK